MERVLVLALCAVTLTALLSGCSASAPQDSRYEYSPHHRGAHNAIIRVVTTRRLVALSFDDGPDPRWTREVLRILRDAGAHATFFAIGANALSARELIRFELAGGNEVGNHTEDHRARLTELEPSVQSREIFEGRRTLAGITGRRITLFRPPWGAFDTDTAELVAADRETLIGWDLPLERFLDRDGPGGVAALVSQVRPGSIILAHDGGGDRSATLAALPRLLACLRTRGFRVVTVGHLLRVAGR